MEAVHESSRTRSLAVRGAIIVGGLALGVLAARAVRHHLRRIEFAHKVVLITGGSRGLGFIMARRFLEEGARVCICARDAIELERAAELLSEFGGELVAIECDVARERDVREMVRWLEHQWGPVDVLINNAGVMRVGPVETMTLADYEAMLDVHVRGPINTVHAVLPGMRRRGAGRIANISSIGGLFPLPHLAPYCASKFALTGLSQAWGIELAKDGIIVTTVCPGLMRTGSAVNAEFKGRHRKEYAWFAIGASLPLLSESAERAARQIMSGIRYGRARVSLTPQTKAAAFVNAVAPGAFMWMLSGVNRVLPREGGIGTSVARGIDSQSGWAPSLLTMLGDRAARRNNELNGHSTTPSQSEEAAPSSFILQEEIQWTEM